MRRGRIFHLDFRFRTRSVSREILEDFIQFHYFLSKKILKVRQFLRLNEMGSLFQRCAGDLISGIIRNTFAKIQPSNANLYH